MAWEQEKVADLCRRMPWPGSPSSLELNSKTYMRFVPTTFTCLQVALLVPESPWCPQRQKDSLCLLRQMGDRKPHS